MNCNETSELLELLALGALSPAEAEAAGEHVAACEACRAEKDRLSRLVGQLRASRPASTDSAALTARIALAARAELAARARRAWPRVVTWGAAAAAAILVVLTLPARKVGPPGAVPQAGVGQDERWRYPAGALPGEGAEGVVVQGKSVYLLEGAFDEGKIVAVDAVTGRRRWTSKAVSSGHIEAAGERVFCLSPAGGGELICLSAADGRVQWRFAAPANPAAPPPCRPLAIRERWVCWSTGSELVLLDAASGTPAWRRTFDGGLWPSGPVAVGESVCVATGKGLWSVSVADGAVRALGRFERRLPGDGRPMLALAGARAFLAGTSPAGACQLYCMDVPGGKMLWRREIPQARSITASGAGVYLRAQRVTALDAYTGRTLWTHAAEGTGPVRVQRGMVCFVDSAGSGRLMGLEAGGGKCLWQVAGVRALHGLSDDCAVAYVGGMEGGLRAMVVQEGHGGTGIPVTP